MSAHANRQASRPPSMLATVLAGAAPTLNRPLSPDAVRRHSLDDAKGPRRPATDELNVGASSGKKAPAPRDFASADKALIRRVHGYMSALQLLSILNERLACDVGADAVPYTIDQLHAEISSVSSAVPAGGNDWGSLRKVLAKARRAGVLDAIDEQVINDFAVVFSLNQKQVLTLKDIVLQREEEEL
jgi:hypothetical protein